MASHYSRSPYSPYSKPNPAESEPLRSKAFSQIDNTIQNYSHFANNDKISEIKKKYEKLLSRSNKSNEENASAPLGTHEFGKSVSTFDAQDENSRWSAYSNSY